MIFHRVVSNLLSRVVASPRGAFAYIALVMCAQVHAQSARFIVMPDPPPPYIHPDGFFSVTEDGIATGFSRLVGFDSYAFTWSELEGYIYLPPLVLGGLTSPAFYGGDINILPGTAYDGKGLVPVMWINRKEVVKIFELPPQYDNALCYGASHSLSIFSGYMSQGNVVFPTHYVPWISDKVGSILNEAKLPVGSTEGSLGEMSANGRTAAGGIVGSYGTQAARWTKNAGIQGIGDIPGGPTDSGFQRVSSDGRVAVGFGNDGRRRLVRWTEYHGLLKLPEAVVNSGGGYAFGVSGDGQRVVGMEGIFSVGNRAFIWDPIKGSRLLQDVLEQEYGLDLGDWILIEAQAISDNGRFIAGRMGTLSNEVSAFLVELPAFCYADCNADKTLDIFDYLCFTQEFNKQSVYANCDNDGSMNIFDYICFGNHFAEGCP